MGYSYACVLTKFIIPYAQITQERALLSVEETLHDYHNQHCTPPPPPIFAVCTNKARVAMEMHSRLNERCEVLHV